MEDKYKKFDEVLSKNKKVIIEEEKKPIRKQLRFNSQIEPSAIIKIEDSPENIPRVKFPLKNNKVKPSSETELNKKMIPKMMGFTGEALKEIKVGKKVKNFIVKNTLLKKN